MSREFTRRSFLKSGAGAFGMALAGRTVLLDSEPAYAHGLFAGPNDRIRFGIIGVGMQGSGLLSNAITLPGVECVAAADLYDGRHTLAKEIAGPSITTTRHYQELLDNKDIAALIIAVPDHWHRKAVVDALQAGKDVYCEKPMSHSVADGATMVAAAKQTGRIVQIGSQRTSSSLLAKAKQLYEQGAIGNLEQVELSLGRNDPTGAWVYPPPADLSPSTLDWDTWLGTAPKKPFDPVSFARWRCWKEYGTGVAGDLMVHLVSGMQYVTGIYQAPDRASSTGGIVRWKDGRNMPDLHVAIFDYGQVPVYCRLSLGTETAEVMRLMGPKGVLEIGEFSVTYIPQLGVDTAPSYYAQGFPRAMRDEYTRQWHAAHDAELGKETLMETVAYRGPSYDDVKPHLWNFFQAVRSRQPIVQDAVFGHHAAAACHMANESYFLKKPVMFDPATDSIRS